MIRIIQLLTLLCFATFGISQSSPLVMTPSLNPDGTQISFSYQGDIWTVGADGGIARRLTIHESYESSPQWSHDGKQIAFQGNRWGNDDIFVMDADGGRPMRLTYHSGNDGGPQWMANGDIAFASRRGFAQVEREGEVHMVSSNGGTPRRMIDAVVLSPSPSADGSMLAFTRGTCRIEREAYTGPANRNLWRYNNGNKTFTQVTDHDAQDVMADIAGGNIYFLSARTGRYNLYRLPLDATTSTIPTQLTNFQDEGILQFDVSLDGSTVVFLHKGRLHKMMTSSPDDIQEVMIKVSSDDRFDSIEHETLTRSATDYAISPDEKQMLFTVRGEIFLKPNDKEKKRAVQLTNHPYTDKDHIWVNDSTIIFASDREGSFDLYSLSSADGVADLYKSFERTTRRLTSDAEEEENLSISPDRTKITFTRGRGQLILMDVAPDGSLSNEKVMLDGWDTPRGVAWSPDSKWLAYALSDLDFNREIYIHPVDGSQLPVNISQHPRSDSSPRWSKDGSKLGFISNRNNSDDDVWFVWLKRADWEKTKRDWEDEEEPEDAKDKKSKKDSVIAITIDFEDIHERLEQVTRLAGNEGSMAISNDGETFYFTTNGGGRQGSPGEPDLMSANWDGDDLTTILTGTPVYAMNFDDKGKNIYAIKSGGNLISIDPSGKKQTSLGFTAKMDIDHVEERKAVFDEGWRRLRDGFYDPEFHGQDWDQLKAKYYDRCIIASTEQDFRTYYNTMLGQLNASHMGMSGPSREDTQDENTGLLGIDIVPVSGGVRVTEVLKYTPADRTESKLTVGDIITSVNGQTLAANTNFYSLFNGQGNERVLLDVRATDGTTREVIIRPTTSTRGASYDDWVRDRRALVDQYSGGRLGYIHIQGMNWPSFERFERELTASGSGKEGMVIDVRYNGGGWTTDMLMAVLNVRQHSFTIPRGAAESLEKEKDAFRNTYPFGERVPLSSWTKPSIALCNENSYSNAEIFSHAYKALGHGTLVGRPTFGAVISTGSAGLLNGSRVRMPFRAWYVKDTNKNMEHGPAVPDIEVFDQPDSKAKGEDPQLQKAVEELLSQIDQ